MSSSEPLPTVERASSRKIYALWSKGQGEILKEYYAQGKPVSWIAHELGRTVPSIRLQASRLGLTRDRRASSTQGHTERTLKSERLSERDIASRIASLLGESPLVQLDVPPFPDLQLMAFADGEHGGLELFLKEVLSLELQPYQLVIAQKLMGTRNLCCVTGRQCGKDFTIGAFTTWKSVVKPNFRTVIVSASQRQSDLLNERMLTWMATSDQLYSSVLRSSREELRLKNGSATFYLPASGLIRGYSDVDIVFVNEARDCGEEVWDAVTPMLSRRGGKLAIFSTPLGRVGKLWECFQSPLYEHVHVASSQNIYLDKGFLESERQRMSNMSYQTEYEGNFMASAQNFFEPVSLQKAVEDYDLTLQPVAGMQYSVGCDWGRRVDLSVFVVVAREPSGSLRVVFVKSLDGVNFQDQASYVVYLRDAFKPVQIVCEENGLGIGICDNLERLGVHITRFKTTSESKTALYDGLRQRFDRREITIPMEPNRLIRELQLLEYEALPSGAVRISHPSGSGQHDDHADALALSCYGFNKPKLDPDRFISVSGRLKHTTHW